MGRISVSEQLKNNFNIDYDELLFSLIKDKDYDSDAISNYLKSKHNIIIKPQTIKIHLKNLGIFNNNKNKSAKSILESSGINYKDLIISLKHLTKEEISLEIKNKYNIEISPNNIYQFCQKHDIEIKLSGRKNKLENQLDLSTLIVDSDNENLFINNKLPMPPRRFHPTQLSGFVIFKDIDAIVELKSELIVESKTNGKIKIWIKIFKDSNIIETRPIESIKIPSEILSCLSQNNYVKICKKLCEKQVKSFESLSTIALRSLLIANAKDLKEMENLLSKCHVGSKKVDKQLQTV